MLKLSDIWAEYRERFRQAHFVRNVSILVGGTGIAQLVSLLAMPFLTRLYSPSEFGIFAVFASLFGGIGGVSSLRYEAAIVLPGPKKEARALLYISISLSALLFFALLLISYIAGGSLFEKAGIEVSPYYFILLPLGVLSTSIYIIFTFCAVRESAYGRIARTRIQQNITTNLSQLLFGAINTSYVGLVLGFILGQVSGFVILVSTASSRGYLSGGVFFNDILDAIKRYRAFALYSAPTYIVNSLSLALPPVVLASIYSAETAGYYAIVQRVLAVPMTFLGISISQVFLGSLSDVKHGSKSEVKSLYIKTLKRLTLLGGCVVFLAVLGSRLFPFVFGEEWESAGKYMIALSFIFSAQIIAIPLSQVTVIFEKQRTQLFLDSFRLVFISIGFIVVYNAGSGDLSAVWTYSIIGAISYVLSCVVYTRIVFGDVLLSTNAKRR